jgi:di/tricarboxylate transporter
MPPDQIFVCCIVVVMVGFFLWEKISPDLVAMGALLLLFAVPFNGHPILWPPDVKQTLADGTVINTSVKMQNLGSIFGNNAILTVTFLMVLTASLERTGLVAVLGRGFEKVAGRSEWRILTVLWCMCLAKSAAVNNTTAVMVFMPMIIGLCRRVGLAPSRFLIPLSYFAIVGGMCTLIGTSTNLVANGIVKSKGIQPIGMFEISPMGICMAVAALAFILLFGRRLLPDRVSLAAMLDTEAAREYLTAAIVSEGSPLVGKRLAETPLAKRRDMRVIEVRRSGNRVEEPLNKLRFEPGDRLILKTHLAGISELQELKGIDVAARSEFGLTYVQTEKAVLTEAVVSPKSRIAGCSLAELNFRQQHGVIILAVHRMGENLRENFEQLKLEPGDTLLIEGSAERMRLLYETGDLVNLTETKDKDQTPVANAPRGGRAWIAILGIATVIVLGALGDRVIAFEWAALAAALLVVLGGCLRKDEIYQAVEWRIIVMILGTLAVGLALDRTGAAKTIIDNMMTVIGGWDRRLILSAVLLLTIVFTELLSNNAVAALLTPLAIELGNSLGMDPRPFIIAVMFGASIGFAVPTGYQTHLLVYGAGGYRFADFFRAGILLDLVLWVLGSLLIPVFWPLG